MPDLVGIFTSNKVPKEKLSNFSRLRDKIFAFYDGDIKTKESDNVNITVVKHHAHDSVHLESNQEAGLTYAWLGRLDCDDKKKYWKDLYALLLFDNLKEVPKNTPPFVGVIHENKPNGNLWLISDPFGFHPIFYAKVNETLVFSTKFIPILQSGIVPYRLNSLAILEFFTFEHPRDNRTFVNEVHLLPPGSVLRFFNGQLTIDSYVEEFSYNPGQKLSANELADQYYHELIQSVEKSVSTHKRVGITLSGGLDSRALLGCAHKLGVEPRTFTFGPEHSCDRRYAKELSQIAGTHHHHIDISGEYLLKWLDHGIQITGGMVKCTNYHILVLADLLKSEVDIVLDGLGGGLLSGAAIKANMTIPHPFEGCFNVYYQQLTKGGMLPKEKAFEPDFLKKCHIDLKESTKNYFDSFKGVPYWKVYQNSYLRQGWRRNVQYGPHQLRPFVDVQTPIFVSSLIKLSRRASFFQLLGQRSYLKMHYRNFANLATVPEPKTNLPLKWPVPFRYGKKALDHCVNLLPSRIQKVFCHYSPPTYDYKNWFRCELRELVGDHLLGNNGAFEGIIKREFLKNVVKEHFSGQRDHTLAISLFLTFESWHRSIKN